MRFKTGIIIASVLGIGGAVAATGYFLRETPEFFESESTIGGFKGIIVNGLTEQPLPDATVSALSPTDGKVVESVKSDSAGRFELVLDDGEYTIVGSLDGYLSRGKDDTGREIAIDDGTQFVNAKLRLWPPAKVHGRVVAGQAGIAATVDVRYKRDASGAGPYEYRRVVADKNGYFSIDAAHAGITTIGISADGFASVDLDDIVLKSGVSLDMGDIPLRDGVSLYGLVVDATSKQPIAHAQIAVSNLSGKSLVSAQTSIDGSYRLAPLDMAQIIVDITADGYYSEQHKLRLGGNTNRELSVNLRRAWGMTLNVQNVTGREPISTHIKITDISTNKVVYDDSLSNGTHVLKSIKGGPFLVEASSADRLTTTTRRAVIGDTVTLRLKPFARVLAHALNSDGSPLADGQYRFYFRPDSSATDESTTPWLSFAASTIELDDLNEGLYRIEIRKSDDTRTASTPEFVLHHGDVRELTIRMTSGGAIRGHVVSTESGYNLARATVTLDKDNRTVTTDEDGYFLIDELPADPFSLSIKAAREGGDATVFSGLTATDGQVTEREFRVSAPRSEMRQKRREEMQRRIENGEAPPWVRSGYGPPRRRNAGNNGDDNDDRLAFDPPNWDGNGTPPEPPNWDGNGTPPEPPNWDGNGAPPAPPNWDGNGTPPAPPNWDGTADRQQNDNGDDTSQSNTRRMRHMNTFDDNGSRMPMRGRGNQMRRGTQGKTREASQ